MPSAKSSLLNARGKRTLQNRPSISTGTSTCQSSECAYSGRSGYRSPPVHRYPARRLQWSPIARHFLHLRRRSLSHASRTFRAGCSISCPARLRVRSGRPPTNRVSERRAGRSGSAGQPALMLIQCKASIQPHNKKDLMTPEANHRRFAIKTKNKNIRIFRNAGRNRWNGVAGECVAALPVSTRLHDALPGQLAQFMQSLKERGFFFLGTAGHTMAFLDIFEGKFRPHVLGGERRDLRSARAFALLTSRRFELTHPLIFKLRAEIVLHRFVLNLRSDSDFIKRLYPRPLLMRDIAQHPRGILAVHLVYLIQEFTSHDQKCPDQNRRAEGERPRRIAYKHDKAQESPARVSMLQSRSRIRGG